MLHRLPLPCSKGVLPPVAFAVILTFLSACQKKEEIPPPAKAPSSESSAGQTVPACCELSEAFGLKDGMGRLVVAFPESAVPKATRLAVLKDATELQSGHGSQSWELPSGTYEVAISDKLLSGVAVRAGHETKVKVGVLHVNASQQTRIEVIDPASGKVLASGHGEGFYGLPIGPVSVRVAGQSETVTIEEANVTEF